MRSGRYFIKIAGSNRQATAPLSPSIEQHENPGNFPECTENIRRADVPAAHCANVDALGARREITGRQRTDEVSSNYGDNVSDALTFNSLCG